MAAGKNEGMHFHGSRRRLPAGALVNLNVSTYSAQTPNEVPEVNNRQQIAVYGSLQTAGPEAA